MFDLRKLFRKVVDPTDYSLQRGDRVTSEYWTSGPVEIVSINWVLGAAAVRLNPDGRGDIIVWPVESLVRES